MKKNKLKLTESGLKKTNQGINSKNIEGNGN